MASSSSPTHPPAVAWAPATLATTPAPAVRATTVAVPRELLELAKQLELVEHQRQQLLLKSTSLSPPASPTRRPASPSTTILAPLQSPSSPSSRHASLGLAPALCVSDVAVCDACAAELASASLLRAHKHASCPQRSVTCPRAGCGATFTACERATHDRDTCVAVRRTQQLLDEHARAHTLLPCPVCHEPTEARLMIDHKIFSCAKREVACQYERFGCHETFAFDQRATHEATACRVARHRARVLTAAATVNAEIPCDWCGQQVLQRKLLDHQEEECVKRERPCPNAAIGCDEWVPVDEIACHVRTQCVVTRERDAMAARAKEMNTLVRCSECGASVKRRYVAAHVARECVSRVVACKNHAHGCRARLRWRDRHLHEDFLALAARTRSMLYFPIGGRASVALQPPTSLSSSSLPTDLSPPWTLELFLWLVDAGDEILDLHAQALDLVETLVAEQREHVRFTAQAKRCKRKLKELKQQRKANDKTALPSDLARAAAQLADEFNAADAGVVTTARALALAKGRLQIVVQDAHRLLCDERARSDDGVVAATAIQRRVETQALDRMAASELLSSEYLSEDELLRLGDVERWVAAVTPATSASASASAETQQRKLLDKRAELQQAMAELQLQQQQQQQPTDAAEAEAEALRLRRRHERELAKVDAKLALVSDNTPPELLDRKGRHVVVSSARNAIVLSGAMHARLAYYRGVAGPNAKLAPRGEVDLKVALTRNRWHHVALCASARELTVVVDGDVKAVARGVFELPFARLGSHAQTGESFQGYLQEVRAWRSCLTREYLAATQIVDVPRHVGDLVAYYTLEEGAGDLVDDMALVQPRAACHGTEWLLYDSAAIRTKFGLPPTPSLRDKTSCLVNQRLKLLAQRARDRETEPLVCRLGCGATLPLRTLECHQRTQCEHRLVVCHEMGCDATFRASERAHHLATDCERATYRNALVQQYAEREIHEPCLLRCGASVKRRHAEKHYTRECPHRLVPCPQHDCGESIVANLLPRHVEVECQSAELVAERTMVENARKRQQDKLMRAENK